jgi:hypothetical protein
MELRGNEILGDQVLLLNLQSPTLTKKLMPLTIAMISKVWK